jgi:hypothetical protein
MLYNLKDDPGETRNLAVRRSPERKALERDAARWSATLGRPAWPSRRVIYYRHDGKVLDVRN